MENLADDALNEFGMKYDGTDEDISPNKQNSQRLVLNQQALWSMVHSLQRKDCIVLGERMVAIM